MVFNLAQGIFQPEVAAHEGRCLGEQLAWRQRSIQDARHVSQHRLAYRFDGAVQVLRQAFGHGDAVFAGHQGLATQHANGFFKADPVGQLIASHRKNQQGGAQDGFGVGAGVFQLFGVHVQFGGHPGGGFHQFIGMAAASQFGAVVSQAAQCPFRQLRNLVVREASALIHAEVTALRHGNQAFEHVRAALGPRQQRVVAQRFCGQAQVAPG